MGHPDGQLCDKIFLKNFAGKSFLFKSLVRTGWHIVRIVVHPLQVIPYNASRVRTMGDERPNGYSSTRNFHICNARVRTMSSSRPDGWSRIGNFLLWWTLVLTIAVRRPDGYIWIEILALRRHTSGWDTTSSGRLIDLPFLGTWKEIRNWSSTERRLDVLLKCPDGCKLNRTFSIQYSVRTDDADLSWRSGR
jgi:hypothetical protein